MSSSKKGIESSSTTTAAIKRDLGRLSASASGHIHRSNRSKSRSNTSFDDLPEDVFTEILCRLPCNKLLVRCKCVSKRWQSLVSFLICDPKFIGRFICLKHDGKTPIIRSLLNWEGNEFRVTKAEELLTTMKMKAEELITAMTMKVEKLLTRMTTKAEDEAYITTADFATIMTTTAEKSFVTVSSKPLAPLFKNLMRSYHLKEKPMVLATYNDLVLCRDLHVDVDDDAPLKKAYEYYYICNPYTFQCVALPRPLRAHDQYGHVTVGFICDLANSGSRCKVVRFHPKDKENSSKLEVEIFSSETGEWRRSIISLRQKVSSCHMNIVTYPYNGMLYYWNSDYNNFVGFDPFRINSSSDGDDTIERYKGRIIEFEFGGESSKIECVGTCGGRLRFIGGFDLISCILPVWELKEEQDERALDRSGKLFLKRKTYSLDREMIDAHQDMMRFCADRFFDPNDENILCMHTHGHSGSEFLRYNIRTRKWSVMCHAPDVRIYQLNGTGYIFPLTVLPWWPTPVPK
ncbi:putative F-box domain-containing protein [Rosa chinensis]|uniref:Putative F-box domain-containing protein n=1 Tax=Rosa chinensis TaxID=74649 RepID=A0A2P6S378_ROSCH|nr:putative F-box domain-containing protein [Rosa chinensis]